MSCHRRGVEDARISRAFAPLGDAVVSVGFVPFVDAPAFIRAADVAMIPFEDTLINRAKSSVKLRRHDRAVWLLHDPGDIQIRR